MKLSKKLTLTLSTCFVFAAQAAPRPLGKFKSTWYRLTMEADHSNEPRTCSLYDMKGKELADVSHNFKRDIDIEGSGKLLDGRVLNYAGMVGGTIRYRLANHPFGDGVGTCGLTPMRTIAVDPNVIPLGAVVRIRETVGMKLADGSIHDGLWRAEDRGGAIVGRHIDLFVGAGKRAADQLHAAGINDTHTVTIDLVQEPVKGNCAR
ncbi:MAG: hypothetical protein JST16_10795 [Bdellovibrionales bacterium]|nr:hypothetical protein [Bdellovibrionales bacterium]